MFGSLMGFSLGFDFLPQLVLYEEPIRRLRFFFWSLSHQSAFSISKGGGYSSNPRLSAYGPGFRTRSSSPGALVSSMKVSYPRVLIFLRAKHAVFFTLITPCQFYSCRVFGMRPLQMLYMSWGRSIYQFLLLLTYRCMVARLFCCAHLSCFSSEATLSVA